MKNAKNETGDMRVRLGIKDESYSLTCPQSQSCYFIESKGSYRGEKTVVGGLVAHLFKLTHGSGNIHIVSVLLVEKQNFFV